MATHDATADEDLRVRYERGDAMRHAPMTNKAKRFVCRCGGRHPLVPCHYPFNCDNCGLILNTDTGQYFHLSCTQNYTTLEHQGTMCSCNTVGVKAGQLIPDGSGSTCYPENTWCLCAQIARGELAPPSFSRPKLLPCGERMFIRDVCAFLIHHYACAAGAAPPLRDPRDYSLYDENRKNALLATLLPNIRPHAPYVDIPRVVIRYVLAERIRDTSAFDHYKLPFLFHGEHLRHNRRTQAEIDDHNRRHALWLAMRNAARASGAPEPPFPASTLPLQ
jgi:hypothetical protein